jgi:hypothetical protein
MRLSFIMAHLLRGRGPAFVREPWRFPVLARVLACGSVRRCVARRLIDASNVARARLTTRGLTVPDAPSNSVVRVASAWMGYVSAAAISTYTYHSQSNVIMFEGQKWPGTQRRV